MIDWLFSGMLVQFPTLKLAYSEGQIGWIPYVLERADDVWEEHRAWGGVRDLMPEPPSHLLLPADLRLLLPRQARRRRARRGRRRQRHLRDRLPAHRLDLARHQGRSPTKLMEGVADESVYKLMRGNAIRMLDLDLD